MLSERDLLKWCDRVSQDQDFTTSQTANMVLLEVRSVICCNRYLFIWYSASLSHNNNHSEQFTEIFSRTVRHHVKKTSCSSCKNPCSVRTGSCYETPWLGWININSMYFVFRPTVLIMWNWQHTKVCPTMQPSCRMLQPPQLTTFDMVPKMTVETHQQ